LEVFISNKKLKNLIFGEINTELCESPTQMNTIIIIILVTIITSFHLSRNVTRHHHHRHRLKNVPTTSTLSQNIARELDTAKSVKYIGQSETVTAEENT